MKASQNDLLPPLPLCMFCKHVTMADFGESYQGKRKSCRAFPEGIPFEILTNSFDHRTLHMNDNGIQFEKYASKETLAPFLARLSDEEIESRLLRTLEYLEENRKKGLVLPPIVEEGKEEDALTLLSKIEPVPDSSLPEWGSCYIPESLHHWLVERAKQVLDKIHGRTEPEEE